MFTKKQFGFIPRLFTALLAGSLLVSACAPAVMPTTLPAPTASSAPVATLAPAATSAPVATSAPAATQVPAAAGSPGLSLDTGSLATGLQTETVPAVSASDNGPYWDLLPEYTRVTLQGYPISSHLMKAQIFVYPLADLAKVNEGAGKIAASLQTLLASPGKVQIMPFMPLFNAAQIIHADVKYLDFKNGRGVRFLTEFDQAILPINNFELIYTYQGLTSDGKYYVAAVLPVNHPSLPADTRVTGSEPPEFKSDYPVYLGNVVNSLDVQAANTFTPDLTQLDAMLNSLEIK